MTEKDPRAQDAQSYRIGLVADTHLRKEDGSDFPPVALDALQGVDLIVHCGDMGDQRVLLDRLESVAPVLAVRSFLDNRQHGEHFQSGSEQRVGGYTRIVEAGGLRVGVVHEFPRHGIRFDERDVRFRIPRCEQSKTY